MPRGWTLKTYVLVGLLLSGVITKSDFYDLQAPGKPRSVWGILRCVWRTRKGQRYTCGQDKE